MEEHLNVEVESDEDILDIEFEDCEDIFDIEDEEIEEDDILDIDVEEDDDPIFPEEFEVEEAEDDEDSLPLDADHPRKKVKFDNCETAEDWVRRQNTQFPVHHDDPDMTRFKHRISSLVERLISWSRCTDDMSFKEWMKQPQWERATTIGFRNALAYSDAEELANAILDHVPQQSQQIMGRQEVTLSDLLDLPSVPDMFSRRLTYIDVPVRVGSSNVDILPVDSRHSYPTKTIKPDVQLQGDMETKLYIGSSIAKRGGYRRIHEHKRAANRASDTRRNCLHYEFIRQTGVVPNFCVVGAWSNPNTAPQPDHGGQDLLR
jgi:hypothetical protein